MGSLLPLATLGSLELSLGQNEAVTARLAPLALAMARADATDPAAVPWVADAAEALIALGRTEEAGLIVGWLERRGRTLDRAWAAAVGGRCRRPAPGRRGDVAGAREALDRAMRAHERLAFEHERARTLLALAGVQRRLRQRRSARQAASEAAGWFERLGASAWVARARAELRRLAPPRGAVNDELTAAERRVAELAAAGMTNREVAAELFISPRDGGANLARAYRKLGIRSRAELGGWMAAVGGAGADRLPDHGRR